MKPVYLDYNATTPVDSEVADFMIPFLREHFGNPSSIHWYGIQTRKAIEEARQNVADFLSCSSSEVIFTSGGTESNNLAIAGIAHALRDKGNHIITTAIEHPAVLEVCKNLEKQGFEITYIDVDSSGMVKPSDIENAIRNSTILVSVMHANNEIGTIQPIENISAILKPRKILFHSDAAQSAGKIEVNVNKLGVDMLSLAGHKLYAPKGIGALYIREGVKPAKLMEGANHERDLRPGTENVLEIAGMGKAMMIAGRDLEQNAETMKKTRDLLFHLINENVPDVIRNGNTEHCLPNTLNISFPGVDASTLLSELTGVAASAGAACHADEVSVSHVLQAMRIPVEIAMGTIRLSTGKHTTESEIRIAAEAICKVVASMRPARNETILPEADENVYKLTRYTHGLGCACKISPRILEKVLKEIPVPVHKDILVSAGTSDDAAVYRINSDTAIVQTVDFFTPVIDDPFQFGAVAAANALSDIYAMGAVPLFALNIVAFPNLRLPLSVLKKILEGANEVASEAGIFILGGHTIEDNEPKFGMVVSGIVHPDKILRNSTAKPGDDLILTKAIGTGILSTALKRGLIDSTTESVLYKNMRTLNKNAAEISKNYTISACTDVTGFGLLGHLREMCMGSETGAKLFANAVPLMVDAYDFAAQGIVPGGTGNNIEYLRNSIEWGQDVAEPLKILLCDAQTSGGLLISLSSDQSGRLLAELHAKGIDDARIIGQITPTKKVGRLTVTA